MGKVASACNPSSSGGGLGGSRFEDSPVETSHFSQWQEEVPSTCHPQLLREA
jgi:hypothetical protein